MPGSGRTPCGFTQVTQVQISWQECPIRKHAQYFLRQRLLLQLQPPSSCKSCCLGTAGRSLRTSSVSVALWHGSHLQKELQSMRFAKQSQYLSVNRQQRTEEKSLTEARTKTRTLPRFGRKYTEY